MGTTKADVGIGSGRSNLAMVALAVVGTLVLSVPTTALLALYLSREGGQENVTAQVQTVFQEGKAEKLTHDKDANRIVQRQQQDVAKPAAHLIGLDPSLISNKGTLAWDYVHNVAFSPRQVEDLSLSLLIPKSGFYYVYCQVGFRGSQCQDGASPLTLISQVYHRHDSYPESRPLLEGMETVCGRGNYSGARWYTSLSQGALLKLDRHHRLYVNVNHPELVDYQDGKTFFGVMMVS